MTNPVVGRKQFIVDVHHPGLANVSKKDLREKLAAMYKVKDQDLCILHGFRTAYGGNKSTGLCLIYTERETMMKFEPKYRLERIGLYKKPETSRQQRHQRKRRALKVRGTKKEAVLQGK